MRLRTVSAHSRVRKTREERGRLGDRHIMRIERQFLPAALEILDTPPSPVGRTLAWVIMAVFSTAVLWACLGHVDVIAVAQGKLIPSGRVKVIQPLEKGVVKTLHVSDYQYVEKGAPLIELDRTLTGADQARLAEELSFIEASIERQELFVKLLDSPGKPVDLPRLDSLLSARTRSEGHASRVRLLHQQLKSYQSKREALTAELMEKDAQRRSSAALISQMEETLPLALMRLQAYQSLRSTGAVSGFDCMDREKEYIDQRQALAAERARQEQLTASVRIMEKEIQALDADARRQALSDIQESERQRQAIRQELTKAADLNARQIITAPVSGEVQQLAVNTIGGVVTEAQPLMLIVPRGEHLEAEVNVENKDIGFIREGQKAEVKVHTFPFTRYGVIGATVEGVTRDAVESREAQGDEKRALAYRMRLRLDRSSMMIDGRRVSLAPGMAVTAEVKTGRRRLIEYFLSPLIRHVDESVQER
ncbi:MAG TPA: HlyD family type I secretion periplasmic adaptor subunit [Deltaproteobacteria bacterium]|jgi:hemolysin D|nr:HlyD family type I secretion periplasmic adaptor subunit [Deltaproteobacteria bacterium]HOI06467.1 HlyD family type I secretion periplasmic adaptor subunit [Deltaproteobacteria bacterium]